MSQLFSFPFDRTLESQLQTEVQEQLKGLLKKDDPAKNFRELFTKKPKHMRWSSHFRLRVLHRQFSANTVPGLPVIVRGARFLYARYRHFKKVLPENA